MDIVAVVEIVIQLAIYVCVVCVMENICACSVCRVVKVQVWVAVAAAAADASLPPITEAPSWALILFKTGAN